MSDAPDAAGSAEGTEIPPEPEPVEDLRLQAPGDDHTQAEWEAAAAGVLRKAGRLDDDDPDDAVWSKLARTTLDGISVPPLGTADLLADLDAHDRPTRVGAWGIRAHHRGDPAAVNDEMLADLAGGATSIWLTVDEQLPADRVGEALHDVHLEMAPVVLQTLAGDPMDAARALVEAIGERTAAPGTNLGVDPLARALAAGDPDAAGDLAGTVTAAARLARDAGTAALVIDASVLHDLGGSDAQELGWSMAVAIAYLRALEEAGIPATDAVDLVEFRYAATDEQFPTIAKLRAARRLWARVLQESDAQGEQRQHAVTSRPMMGKYDPYVNLLRTTVAAFAAGVGGADGITVLPFDSPLGRPDALGRRLARNISHLLIQESHVAAVADPAGGSYVTERLTEDLAQAAWEELGRIESAGGALAALTEVRERVAAVAEERERQVATRRRPLTGLTEFPHLGETLPEREGPGDDVRRYGAAFEALRDEPAKTPVFLATLGSVAAHTARATFATNLLAAGGIEVEAAGPTGGVDDVVAAWREAGQPGTVCLAGTDQAYAEWGADVLASLRDAGASYLLLAGTPGERSGIPGEAVDDSAAMGVDALAFLTRTREALA
ncbi:methylmalonyl-CoA mutase [Nocardioides rotundus]|uniref:methylmalonyl-CoA mutase family protein n=1 Tax=Nocardioides rotundus TaxID=1774216 RepID=UPI001CC044A3|nr:methylmalonyl-CoA mutase family protein [Nocardioides rotundus]UAL28700.1 methylmalonyl-CoA mutase [Nocardioides rotundus]